MKQVQFTTIDVTDEEVTNPPPAENDLKDQNISNEDKDGENVNLGPQAPPPGGDPPPPPAPEPIADFVSEEPVYPGGLAKLYEEIYKNITYPEMERENNISGTVYVSFVVEKNGNVTDVRTERGVTGGPNLQKEAEKAVAKLSNFTPAKMNGKSVRYRYRIPIKFTLK